MIAVYVQLPFRNSYKNANNCPRLSRYRLVQPKHHNDGLGCSSTEKAADLTSTASGASSTGCVCWFTQYMASTTLRFSGVAVNARSFPQAMPLTSHDSIQAHSRQTPLHRS